MLILDASPTGRALLRTAVLHRVSVGLDSFLEPSSSFFYPEQNHFDFGYQPDILQKTEKGQGDIWFPLLAACAVPGIIFTAMAPDVSLDRKNFFVSFAAKRPISNLSYI